MITVKSYFKCLLYFLFKTKEFRKIMTKKKDTILMKKCSNALVYRYTFTDKIKNNNKRPRGLDPLLGHLVVKRIPVMYKHSSTNSP